MKPLYRYMGSTWADRFLATGTVRFAPLTYYRDMERDPERADPWEGAMQYAPAGGLVVDPPVSLPPGMAFRATVRQDDIYVLCLSARCDAELGRAFQAEVCIEIFDADRFVRRIRGALARQDPKMPMRHGPVTYRDPREVPNHLWALGDEVAMMKRPSFANQDEYRVCFAENGAFRPYAGTYALTDEPAAPKGRVLRHSDFRHLSLGSMRRICRIVARY